MLTEEQLKAKDMILSSMGRVGAEFRLGGYAGTGKTTLIADLVENEYRGSDTAVCAFTGKAVSVLRRKGIHRAETCHSTIYRPTNGVPKFVKRKRSEVGYKRCIVDEGSMIYGELHRDLRSIFDELIYVGDPGQLEPVSERGDDPHLMRDCHYVLETIHRQVADSPILRFASHVRAGKVPTPYAGSDTRLRVEKFSGTYPDFASFDQIICGRNSTRTNYNTFIRDSRGHKGVLAVDEKIIILKNNRELGVFNGQVIFVKEILANFKSQIIVNCEDEIGNMYYELPLWTKAFGVEKPDTKGLGNDIVIADYAYAITTHKAQGSEYGRVLVHEETGYNWNMNRWRYTAATRASDHLHYLYW